MSTNTILRRYIQNKKLQSLHSLINCNLVIDGDSFFKESYKNSSCQFLLGPDCDAYARYLQKRLYCFTKCNINCYVVFKGVTRDDLDTRQKIQEEIIEERRSLENYHKPSYFDPLLVKDVQNQVLKQMGINYFCCEYESIEAIIGIARAFKCPVLTKNLEYCCYGVSCIPPQSISWNENDTAIQCEIYDRDTCKSSFGVYNEMPMFLSVLSMISELPQCGSIDDIRSVIHWVKRHRKDGIDDIADTIDDINKRDTFRQLYDRIKLLYLYPTTNLAVKYYQRKRPFGLFKDDKRWFSKGVSSGRIAIPYTDIKRKALVMGCSVINDDEKPDAIEAAAKIITFAHCLLTNSQQSNLIYIGRKGTISDIWESNNCWKEKICNRDIFTMHGKIKKLSSGNPFPLFIKEVLSKRIAADFDYLYVEYPTNCWILVVTLLYYIHNVNKKFIDVAYYILFCHVMLGPVSKEINKKNMNYTDCQIMYEKLEFLFKFDLFSGKFDRSVLHNLAEFLHCLQHMNYLYTLCGHDENIPCTVYHETYNATFVYNTLMFMKDKNDLMKYLESNFNGTWPLEVYKSIVSKFDNYVYYLEN